MELQKQLSSPSNKVSTKGKVLADHSWHNAVGCAER